MWIHDDPPPWIQPTVPAHGHLDCFVVHMSDTRLFHDRRTAGRELAEALRPFRDDGTVVIGLPRGGVVVADEVATTFRVPLDVCVVKKLGAPMQPELGLGAIAEGGEIVLDRRTILLTATTEAEVAEIIARAELAVSDRVRRYRRGRPPIDVEGKTVIVVDDGIATGGTARAALRALGRRGPSHLVIAAPVGSLSGLRELKAEADAVVCPYPAERFVAVGLWYRAFDQVPEAEVVEILDRANESLPAPRLQPPPLG
jgi:putative phosphoribosyl transferase